MLLNRKCNFCGSEYYICRSCIKAGNAWKNVCCSKECFINMMKSNPDLQNIQVKKSGGNVNMKKTLLRGELNNGLTVDITGYDIGLYKFDSTDGKTYHIDDFKFLYVPSKEIKEIVTYITKQTENKIKASENLIEKNQKATKTEKE